MNLTDFLIFQVLSWIALLSCFIVVAASGHILLKEQGRYDDLMEAVQMCKEVVCAVFLIFWATIIFAPVKVK